MMHATIDRVCLLLQSPTSLKVTHRQLTMGARLSFKDVFTMEYRLARHFVARDDTDLFEGCRASVSVFLFTTN
jgi:enoyl-CoA hydratase/carnithine racemase